MQTKKSRVPSPGGPLSPAVLNVILPSTGDSEARYDFGVRPPDVSIGIIHDNQIVRTAGLPRDGRESPLGKELRSVVGGDYGSNGWHDKRPSSQGK